MFGIYWKSNNQELNPVHLRPEWNQCWREDRFQIHHSSTIYENSKCKILLRNKVTKLLSNEVLEIRQEKTIADQYSKRGEKFITNLDGQFFIVLYDTFKKKLFLYNNRYETSKLYFYEDDEKVFFSSSLTTIVRNLEKIEINKGSIRSFLSNGFTLTDQTQIKGIRKLLPSYRIIFSENTMELAHHWDEEFSFERNEFKNLEKHLDLYEKIYSDGIRNYLDQHPTNELGCLLSGGHDTSFAFIHSSRVFKKPVHAFTVTFDGWSFDESSYAKNICAKNGGIFHPVPFMPEDIDLTISLIRTAEEPVVGTSLPLHLLCMQAGDVVETMFGGDGGDTLWGEYYPVGEYHKYIKNMPLAMRRFFHLVAKGLVKLTDWERFWELEHVASLFSDSNYYDQFMRKLCTYRHFSDDYQKKLFTSEMWEDGSFPESIHEIKFTKEKFSDQLIEGKLFNAFYTYMSFYTTKSVEHFDMNFYLPTINRDVMQFITSLPENWVNGGTTFHRLTNNKTINRRFHKIALARHLKREEIYNRSFDIPWYRILKPRGRVLDLLEKRLINRGWYQERTIRNLFSDFKKQEAKDYELLELKHHGYRIFTLLSLEIWCMEYLDQRFTENPDTRISLEDYLTI